MEEIDGKNMKKKLFNFAKQSNKGSVCFFYIFIYVAMKEDEER